MRLAKSLKPPKAPLRSQLPHRSIRHPDLTLYGDTFSVMREPKPVLDRTRDDPQPRPDVAGLTEPPSPRHTSNEDPFPDFANLSISDTPPTANIDLLNDPNLSVSALAAALNRPIAPIAPQTATFAVDLTGPSLAVNLPARPSLSTRGRDFLASLPTEGVTSEEREILMQIAEE